ncbi:MAG: hypothetical protein ABI921_05525 [Panacibacter sp.]
MKKILLSVTAFIAVQAACAQLPAFEWAKNMGDIFASIVARSTVVDASGNVYSTGDFGGTVDFDPGPGTFYLTSGTNNAAFILKLDAAGNFVWAKNMANGSSPFSYSIVLDATGNVLATGTF